MNTNIDQEVIETPTDVTIEPSEKEMAETSEPQVDWQAKATELEEKNKQLYARLKREEKKENPNTTVKPSSTVLSAVDQYNLLKADVHPDDINEVLEYAAWKGVTVTEALNSSPVKATLADKKSERDTAAATSVKGTGRTQSRLSDDNLLAMSRKGELPESDADIARLISLRKKQH